MKVIYLTIVLFISSLLTAQTGPAGVNNSSNNGLWLRADALDQSNGTNVSFWSDQSGNANHAVQTDPARQAVYYTTSSINNQPVIRLDGNDDQLVVADADILDNTDEITYFAVIRPYNVNGDARGILGKRITYTVNEQYAYTWFFYTGNRLFLDTHTNNDRFNTSSSFSNSTNYLLSLRFNGNLAASQRSRIWSGSNIVATSYDASTSLPNSNQDVAIGALNVDYGTYFNADYAEIIQFNYAVDSLERILINNYLSAKYDIAISANDLYTQDDPANGDYDFDVAGIGRIDATSLQDNAQGSGLIAISNPTDLNNNEFLIWGHNGDSAKTKEFTDIPTGLAGRFSRVWRFSEVNGSASSVDVGDVDIRFDLNELGEITTTDLRLLIDTDNDGEFADETPIDGANHLGDSIYEFSGVSQIADGSRMTIGTANISRTPLPVELTSFEAELLPSKFVALKWQTESEINNHYFTVEKSVNKSDWQVLAQVDGNGNKNEASYYKLIDVSPFSPITYYRLSQTDFDGQTKTYETINFSLKEKSQNNVVKLYPNPAKSELVIEGYSSLSQLKLYDIFGKEKQLNSVTKGNSIHLNIQHLNAGNYILQLGTKRLQFLKQ